MKKHNITTLPIISEDSIGDVTTLTNSSEISQDEAKKTALTLRNHSGGSTQNLLADDASPFNNETALIMASITGDSFTISQLLLKGPEPKTIHEALMYAASEGHCSAIQQLLAAENLQINHKDEGGNTALSLAIDQEHIEVVELLLNTPGIDANTKDKNGNTPLVCAEKKKNQTIINLLLKVPNITAPCIEARPKSNNKESASKVGRSSHFIKNRNKSLKIAPATLYVNSEDLYANEKFIPTLPPHSKLQQTTKH